MIAGLESHIQETGRGRVLDHFHKLKGRCGLGPPLEQERRHGLSPLLKWDRRRWLSGGGDGLVEA